MLFLRARYYSPSTGRFISHDTWDGDAYMPMSYNMWLYGLGNPMRYTDPSGFFSEDAIMEYLGVNTWDEVINEFTNGKFRQNWGLLEVLRRAKNGDKLYIQRYSEYTRTELKYLGKFYGGGHTVKSIDGVYSTRAYIILVDENNNVLTMKDELRYPHDLFYQLRRSDDTIKFETFGYESYLHLRLRPDKVDWTSVGLDAVGTVSALGIAAKVARTSTLGQSILNMAGFTSGGASIVKNLLPCESSNDAFSTTSTIFSALGLVTSGVPVISGTFSLGALILDLNGLIEYSH